MRGNGFVGAMEYELVGERASSLGQAGRKLTAALEALAASSPGTPAHDRLVGHAGVALWELIVHREACGFTQHDPIYEIWSVPPEVRIRMGPG